MKTTLSVETYEEHLAWELARCAPGLTAEDALALQALLAAILKRSGHGDTRVPLGQELETVARPLVARLSPLRAEDPLSAIFGHPGEYKPFIVAADSVGTERAFAVEAKLGAMASLRGAASCETGTSASLPDGPHLDRLSPAQRAAVEVALRRKLALITGGPGTGKTSIVSTLLIELGRQGVRPDRIALAAPTGKAAYRLSEALGGERSAETLHRLLGFSPRTRSFARDENFPLDADIVIVDEASMIDAEMMRQLFAATRKEARLVLLGDASQLPSVAPGAPFRDLLRTMPKEAIVRLTESYRASESEAHGRAILSFAASILSPSSAITPELTFDVRRDVAELRFSGVEMLPLTWRGCEEAILDRWLRRMPLAGTPNDPSRSFDRVHAQRILTVTREPGMATSASQVNAAARTRREGVWRRHAGNFAPFDPILFSRNDYRRELFNGDEGIVLEPTSGSRGLSAVFRRGTGFVSHDLGAVANDVELAYATTVHRSQGGEFDDVLLVLPERDTDLATRELVYTAVTRARKSVVIVGDIDILHRALGRTNERITWSG